MIIQGNTSLPRGIHECQVELNGGEIRRVITNPSGFGSPDLIVPEGHTICPGFIDGQINGGFGKEFKTDLDSIGHVTAEITKYGVTSIVPTVTTKSLDTYRDHLNGILGAYPGPGTHARVLGIHLEGPVLNPKKRGAHPEDLLLSPAGLNLDVYLSPATIMVTIAPELPGGWALAKDLVSRGLRVGIGHSLADYDDVVKNFMPESMHIVHTYNAMSNLEGRGPGLVGVALDREDFHASVIADLVHVHPASLRLLWEARRRGTRLFGISDGSAVLGLNLGSHVVGKRTIERREDRAVLEGTETLVGSVLTMNTAARNLRRVTGCEMWEAVNFVSLNTATYYGVGDRLGSIEPGKAADLCVVDDDFNVRYTVVNGTVAFNDLT